MFVSAEDFNVRPYKLPLLDDAAVLAEFTSFVQDWEDEWLPKIFGSSFYASFIEGVNLLPDEWAFENMYGIDDQVVKGLNVYKSLVALNTGQEPGPASDVNWELLEEGNRWLKVIKGTDYTPVIGVDEKWVGLMAAEKFAIFSEWLKASVHNVSGVTGVTTAQVENTEVVSNAYDITSSWNKFARLIGGKNRYDRYNNLYGFLLSYSSTDTFDDTFDESFHDFAGYLRCEFKWPGRLNPFNI